MTCPVLSRPLARLLRYLPVVLSLVAGLPGASYAEMNITGTAATLHIVASGVSVAELLAAVAERCEFRYHTSVPLDENINGAYSGSPEVLVPRLLSKYDYFIKRRGGAIELFVLGKRDAARSPAAPPPGAPAVAASAVPATVAADIGAGHGRR